MKKDSINWAEMKIPVLFSKMFIPTILGMLMMSSINIIDGIFVGQGVGSDALAAVNIVAPFFLITAGVGLMFGVGASIVASVHQARGKKKAADINVTQAFIISVLIMLLLTVLVMSNMDVTAKLLGSSNLLLPYVKDYMHWIIPALSFGVVMSIGLFIVRLDGSPKYAMMCNFIPGIVNVVFDWLFIFPIPMGISGAALATGLAQLVGCIMVLAYMAGFSQHLHFCRLKLSMKSLRLMLRNIKYQIQLGASGMIGELAIACMMFLGNYMFIGNLREDGVAAFSVACYCFPLVFMVGNAISQSAQPIISYNYGAGLIERVRQTFRISITAGLMMGSVMTLSGIYEGHLIISLFIPDKASAAFHIANEGFSYFSMAFLLFTLNLVLIGYLQSMEKYKPAITFMLLRGVVFIIPAFLLLPSVIGIPGLWLAVPASEFLTLLIILFYNIHTDKKKLENL